jgi:hypothetical protein
MAPLKLDDDWLAGERVEERLWVNWHRHREVFFAGLKIFYEPIDPDKKYFIWKKNAKAA